MLVDIIENYKLDKQVKIYRECIGITLSNNFNASRNYIVDDIELSGNEVFEICSSVISIYGGIKEKRKYYNKYGFNNVICDVFTLQIISDDRLKYIYEFREQYGSNSDKCREFAKFMGISIIDIATFAREYAVKYLKLSAHEYNWLFAKNVANKDDDSYVNLSYKMLFDVLLKFEDEEDIIHLIYYSGHKLSFLFTSLRNYMRLYCSNMSEEEKNNVYNNLENKLLLFKEYKNREYNEKKEHDFALHLNNARLTVLNFINCDKPFSIIKQYCEYSSLTTTTFMKHVSLVEKYDPDLYQLYVDRFNLNKKEINDNVIEFAKIVAFYALYGVPTESGVRNFDLIDFYALTDLDPIVVVRECQKFLTKSEYTKLSKMLGGIYIKSRNYLSSSVNSIDIDIEFNCKKDKDGFPIKGTGRKITQEEVDSIIELFKFYNIPFNLFKVAIDRIKNKVDLFDIAPIDFVTDKKIKVFIKK